MAALADANRLLRVEQGPSTIRPKPARSGRIRTGGSDDAHFRAHPLARRARPIRAKLVQGSLLMMRFTISFFA